jgi:hypothetical protein
MHPLPRITSLLRSTFALGLLAACLWSATPASAAVTAPILPPVKATATDARANYVLHKGRTLRITLKNNRAGRALRREYRKSRAYVTCIAMNSTNTVGLYIEGDKRWPAKQKTLTFTFAQPVAVDWCKVGEGSLDIDRPARFGIVNLGTGASRAPKPQYPNVGKLATHSFGVLLGIAFWGIENEKEERLPTTQELIAFLNKHPDSDDPPLGPLVALSSVSEYPVNPNEGIFWNGKDTLRLNFTEPDGEQLSGLVVHAR